MAEVYVIVHPGCVNAIQFPDDNEDVRRNMQGIMSSKPFFVIGDYESPNKLHESMIPPSDELEVKVAGAYLGRDNKWCVNQQYSALSEKGYNVSVDESACLKV